MIAVGVIGGVAIAGAVFIEMDRSKPAATPPSYVPGYLPTQPPQSPGEAPPGKVWSPEHGHWHDAATGQAPQ